MKINADFSMNGINGFTWGNIFQILQLPQYVRDNVYFQVNSIKHVINSS